MTLRVTTKRWKACLEVSPRGFIAKTDPIVNWAQHLRLKTFLGRARKYRWLVEDITKDKTNGQHD